MQNRSTYFNTEIDVLPVCDESNDDVFNQSTHKLNICGQTRGYFPKLVNNVSVSTLTSSSLQTNTSALPPKILKITPNTSVLIGETASLKVNFTPLSSLHPFSIKWSKKGKLLHESDRITIENDEEESTLVIKEVMDSDNGKYDIEVKNEFGKDHTYTSLAVKGPPEPPAGTPYVTISSCTSMTISWSGSTYDGGSVVIGYAIETKKDDSDWEVITEDCQCTSYTVRNLTPNSIYSFRVRAFNAYGFSKESTVSDSVPLIVNHFSIQSNQNEIDVENRTVNIRKDVKLSELYDIKEEVGRGRFGICKRAIELSTNKEKAAKIIRCLRAKDREQVYQEVEVMNRLRHRHLLQLENAYELSREIILITEFISGGELFERIVADDYVLTEHECILFMRQICEGVSYMHRNKIMHLDLKPENILCKTRTSYDIKIIDFGLARQYTDEPLRVLFGTPEFVAPEVINYEPVSPKSDMWSVGVICYVLLSGLSPFMGENDTQTFSNVTQADFDFDDESFDNISCEAKAFISLLLVKRPEKRMTADECLDHDWLCLKEEPLNHIKLPTEKLKKFLIRRKWQKTGTAIRALGRIANLSLAKISCREVKEEPSTSDHQNS